ncbi:MAG: 6-pyruvoyl-tetrahydropterin synthase-related protein [bacterium]|nr:6-pyruvoyl-tetrahydropterin synthase-related protein [bacterium]
MEKTRNLLNKYILFLVLLLSLPAVRYLFVHGFFGVSDDLHIGWLYEMDRAVKMLQFPPRFVPDLSFAFGYPLFNFVYPLPFYIGELFHLVGFSLVNSVKLVFGLSIPFSMYFMYRFLKEYLSGELALAGSVLYVYVPYRAVEIFVRGTIGEIVAFILFPLVMLSFTQLTKEKVSRRWIGITALSVAALILSHNIMAYMFMPFALLFLVARIVWLVKDKKRVIIRSITGLLLGLLTSIYFWFPAINESGLMHYDTVFNFYDHFATLKQFITPYFGYGASVPGPYDTMSFYMGWVGLLLVLVALIQFIVKFKKFSKEVKILFVWAVVVFFASIFMMNHRSAFLWRNLPLLPYFQFPWRFLSMITFCTPIFLLAFSKYKFGKIISFVVIVLAILLNFNYFKTSEYLGREDEYYLNRYIPALAASVEYGETSEEYLRLPKNTSTRPSKVYPRAYSDTDAVKNIEEINALDATISTDFTEEFTLNYNKYYYPGWSAKIDGKKTPIVPGEPYGQITLLVPSGTHEVRVYYRESSKRLIFDLVSLAGFGVVVFIIIKKKK